MTLMTSDVAFEMEIASKFQRHFCLEMRQVHREDLVVHQAGRARFSAGPVLLSISADAPCEEEESLALICGLWCEYSE